MKSQNKKFNVVSTFAGCGGSSLGYTLAGGKVLLAVEWDDNAVESYRANFPNTPIFHGDIKNLTVEKVLETIKLKPYELDILDGSPPCQGFSISGKRDFCDLKNQLYNEYIRLLKGLMPKTFIMENVKGMLQGNMKLIFKDILTQLKKAGYNVQVKLMNSQWYNTATSRERVIFIGVRKDLHIKPSHPKPSHKPITVKEALKNIKPTEIRYSGNPKVRYWLRKTKPGESIAKNHPNNTYFNYRKIDINKPCPTITRTGSDQYFMPNNRIVTVNELKVLQSFPPDYILKGTEEQQHSRVGNSVPPQLMKHIATHVYENILQKIS